MPGNEILAIIVTYNPDIDIFPKLLRQLRAQNIKTLVIDNNSDRKTTIINMCRAYNVDLVLNKENLGVASAQNIGLQTAIRNKFTYTLIFDQDSIPQEEMIKKLRSSFDDFPPEKKVTAVCPVILDRRITKEKCVESYKKELAVPEELEFAISSGTLILNETLNVIGLMDEHLFIDHVDHEWCFRAKSLGYSIYRIPSAEMYHTIGDNIITINLLRPRNISTHSPRRSYYIVRNTLITMKMKHVPVRWSVHFAKVTLITFIISLVLLPMRRQRILYFCKGLLHGLLNRGGPDR